MFIPLCFQPQTKPLYLTHANVAVATEYLYTIDYSFFTHEYHSVGKGVLFEPRRPSAL